MAGKVGLIIGLVKASLIRMAQEHPDLSREELIALVGLAHNDPLREAG